MARVSDLGVTRRALDALVADRTPVRPGTSPQPTLFANPELGVHFGRVVLIEEPASSRWSSSLVLETNFDSTEPDRARAVRAHLRDFTRTRGAELEALFAGSALKRRETLADSLFSACQPSTAEYMGRVDRDLPRIELERAVHEVALEVVSGLPSGIDIETLRNRIRDELRRRSTRAGSPLHGFRVDAPPPPLPDADRRARFLEQTYEPWAVNALRTFGGTPLLGALVAAATSPVWASWVGLMLYRAAHDPEFDLQREAEQRSDADAARLLANDESEDHVMHNALTHLVPLKRGLFGSLSLRFLHRYVGLMARNYFNYIEQLGGIPSIHFAKWLLIDGGERLLFLSNYDASWESYLGDFVDQAAIGLNLAWCLTEGYPKSQWFHRGGAYDEERFKAWARAHQRPTQLFYSAEPTRSLSSLNNATWLRHGLHDGQTAGAPWARRLT